MSTIDTVESVIDLAAIWSYEGAAESASMLTRYATMITEHKALQAKYAALLEAVNRPVTQDEVEFACRAICKDKGHDPDERRRYNGGKLVRDKQGNFFPYWTTYEVDAKTSLEAHMAALREEVGK